ALAGVVGWWLWVAFCSFLAARSEREPQRIFSVDALANLILLIAFADIMYKFSSYATAAILCLVMLSSFRLALLLHVGKKRPNQN
ncbi:MAG: hypothetical protein JSV16_08615, partial [Candidatus Hydrogenedentota bacterium]